MINVWQKMYKICLQNSIKIKISPGHCLGPCWGAYSAPQLDFVPTDQVGQTGYFLVAMALNSL